MAFSVGSLADYIIEDPALLVRSSVLGAPTIAKIKEQGNVMVGVKSAEQVNILESTAVFQDGTACGFDASGTTTISQRKVTVVPIKVNENFCYKTLNSKYLSMALSQGSRYTDPKAAGTLFMDSLCNRKVENINYALEQSIWQGNDVGASGNNALYDGIKKIVKATATAIITNARVGTGTITTATNSTSVAGVSTLFTTQCAAGDKLYSGTTLLGTISSITNATTIVLAANAAAAVTGGAYNIFASSVSSHASPITSITTSNVIEVLNGVYALIPKKILDKEDTVIFVGMDVLVKYNIALTALNLYHYPAIGSPVNETTLHGTNIKMIATVGLNDTNEIYAMRVSNLYLGTDLLDEQEKFEFFYAKEADVMRFVAEFKIGVQVAFPDEIARFQLLA